MPRPVKSERPVIAEPVVEVIYLLNTFIVNVVEHGMLKKCVLFWL